MVIAIDTAGMAIAFPVGIGIALVLGVITNYLAQPAGNVTFLIAGVCMVTLAIILDAFAYKHIVVKGDQTPAKGVLISVMAGK